MLNAEVINPLYARKTISLSKVRDSKLSVYFDLPHHFFHLEHDCSFQDYTPFRLQLYSVNNAAFT